METAQSPTNSPVPGNNRARGRGGRGRPRGRGGPRGRGRVQMRGRGRGNRGPRRGRGRGGRGQRGAPNNSPMQKPVTSEPDKPNLSTPSLTSTPTPKAEKKESVKSESCPVLSKTSSGGSIADRWKQKMDEQKEEDYQKNRDKLRGRRRGGVKFMDTQIRNLIVEMKRLSSGPGAGLATVTYGHLFDSTSDSMPALSATLNVAKKRDVVTFEGDMLMQGVHSDVVITLMKDEIEDTPDFESVIGIKPVTVDTAFSNAICSQCSKTVYPMDRISANDQIMHKNCFRCTECKCSLKLGNFAYNGGKFYCETHYQQKYRQGTSYDF